MALIPRTNLPQTLRTRGLPATTGIQTPGADAFGAGIGRAIQQTGGLLAQVTNQMQDNINTAAVKEADAKLATRYQDLQNGFLNQRGKNAVDGAAQYKTDIEKARQEIMDSLPNSRARSMFQSHADSKQLSALQTGTRHTQTQTRQYESDASEARVTSSIQGIAQGATNEEIALHKRNLVAEITSRAEQGGWSPEQRQQVILSATTQAHQERITQLSGTGDIQDLRVAKNYFEQNKEEIDPRQWDNIENGFAAIERQKRDLVASDLEVSVFDPEKQVAPAEIDAAWEAGIINTKTRTRLQKERIRQEVAYQKKIKAQEYIDVGAPLDHTNKDHKSAVENEFARQLNLGEQRGEVRANTYTQQSVIISQRTGILPKQVKSDMIAYARAGSPEQKAYYANIYANLQESAPHVLRDIPSQEREILGQIYELTGAGASQEEAVELVNSRYEHAEKVRNEIDKRYRVALEEKDNIDAFQDLLDASEFDVSWGFGGAPEPTAQMQADFNTLVAAHYLRTADIEVARNAAFDDMKLDWSTSSINGENEVMKFAPEIEYRNLDPDLLREDLRMSVESLGYDGFDPKVMERFRVVSDDITARQRPGSRTYQLSVLSEDGYPDIVRNTVTGRPVRWRPDAEAIRQQEVEASLKIHAAEGAKKLEKQKERETHKAELYRNFKKLGAFPGEMEETKEQKGERLDQQRRKARKKREKAAIETAAADQRKINREEAYKKLVEMSKY